MIFPIIRLGQWDRQQHSFFWKERETNGCQLKKKLKVNMNHKYKQNFIQAGKLAKEVREYGKALIQPGASYVDVFHKIRTKIYDLGAFPAFPPQLALDNVAAHFLPMPGEEIIFSDQVVKLDVGVCYEGAIGDCAVTVDLSGKFQNLIDAAESALSNAEKIIRVGLPVSEIGRVIHETIDSFGFTPVKNLSGHGLGEYKIHTSPIIPNYDDQSKAVIRAGMTFAIEPFATNGAGLIYEGGAPTIFGLGSSKPLRTELSRSLLAFIRTLKGLPFTFCDLIREEWSLEKVQEGLKELIQAGVVIGYAPLLEQGKGVVAQAENSVLVDEKGNVQITTR
jgi:methionyl aminopeptidase